VGGVSIDPVTGKLLKAVPQGADADEVWYDPGFNSYYFLRSAESGGVAVVDAVTETFIGNVPSGATPWLSDHTEQFALILHRLAAGDLPAVEHCSGGKDRTGVFSAILLTALGVPRDVVVQDYLLTTQYTLEPESLAKTLQTCRESWGFLSPRIWRRCAPE
jgi:Tyrosine phosphatase family